VVALSPPSINYKWGTLSFVSTLYLCPILDRLLSNVPRRWHAEIRLGLQEALVNAVKHGNQLDTRKVISVRFATRSGRYWWIISDQGQGFEAPCCCPDPDEGTIADHNRIGDCGRGLYILHQIFDEVRWVHGGRELHLCKRANRWFGMPRVL
jgi:anti-sigma regulatory factor (Ser/Thr protein kinase)